MTDTGENPAFLAALKGMRNHYKMKNVKLLGAHGTGKGTFLYYLNNPDITEFMLDITCSVATMCYPAKNVKFYMTKDSGFSKVQTVWDQSVSWGSSSKNDICVLCFTVNEIESFESIVPLYKPGMILLGLRSDLPSQVPLSVIKEKCKGALYIKCSSRNMTGFDTFRQALIDTVKTDLFPKDRKKSEEPKVAQKSAEPLTIAELDNLLEIDLFPKDRKNSEDLLEKDRKNTVETKQNTKSHTMSEELSEEIKKEIDYIKSRLDLLKSLL
tara:strand:+ start:1736 stop:2542 length:807 start_codon:yes stop_codon:yes gene_type:complete